MHMGTTKMYPKWIASINLVKISHLFILTCMGTNSMFSGVKDACLKIFEDVNEKVKL